MESIQAVSPIYWITIILIAATLFTVLWGLDALTHKELVKVDITDQELQAHRNILIASMLMEISLVTMFWYSIEVLPFFIAFLIVRTTHEFIDELKFHVDRCSPYESRLHLGMWIFVFIKTVAMFIWGYFTNYQGVLELPIAYYVWGFIVFSVMSVISLNEWKRG